MQHAQVKLRKIQSSFKNKKKETIFIGIHSRRTDHLEFQVKKLNLVPLKPSYFLEAIELFKQKFSKKKFNLAFIYVSDDLEWGKQNLGTKKGGKDIFFVSEEAEDKGPYDMALLGT